MKKLALTASLLLTLCASTADGQRRAGSIFDPDLGPQSAIANKTARRPGDVLTVLINETQDVSNEESSQLRKETSLDKQLTNLDVFPNAFNPLPAISASSQDEFRGEGTYEKTGQFTARITVIVADTLPNGNLVVSGRREIRIDNEVKLIEFTGVVRRFDILANNTVESELVANAKVSYEGMGTLTNTTNRRGLNSWVYNAIDWLWPF